MFPHVGANLRVRGCVGGAEPNFADKGSDFDHRQRQDYIRVQPDRWRVQVQVAVLSKSAGKWSAGSSNLYALSSMLDDIVNKKKTAAELFNLYFVPIVNIDGYDISWNSNQLQRKNANEVDLNRN
ncbi:hypothetical protein AaE_011171 [Aphanomyces astaci]|uniref:Peptidase M14 domain-containing protein n=1 Tax=Aphanomyces astaci TaxID=112090 RepID=A0A6A4ZUA9_APHAT|nr:hypothetical protein AaE_011171 [Aphanomyces astaci]